MLSRSIEINNRVEEEKKGESESVPLHCLQKSRMNKLKSNFSTKISAGRSGGNKWPGTEAEDTEHER
jgi:hypothetical protein